MDPYLKKRQAEEEEIRRQVDAKLKKEGHTAFRPKDVEKPKPELFNVEFLGDNFVQGPGGLFVPAEKPIPNRWGTAKEIYGYPVYTTSTEQIKKSLKYAYDKILAETLTGNNSAECNCPICSILNNQLGSDPIPAILRAIHGRPYEYVYSETLKAHVRIGESLKAK